MILPRPSPAGRFAPEALFRPASVVVVGAATPAGAQVLANLRAGGFAGSVAEVADAAGVAARDAAADLAVLASDDDAEPALAALAARGTFAAVAVGMPRGLAQAAARTGVRVLGPGSFGVAVPAIALNASRAHIAPRAGRLALVSQSAALCRAVLDWAEPNGVGFSHVVGVGGNADLGFAAVLDWLSRDAGTGAILLDIRRLKDPRAFLSAARAAARLRPVVAVRAGGLLLDPSGQSDRVLVAALRRAGVLSVSRLADLLAAAETLSRARPARSDGLAVVTNAIGLGRMAADAALADGLELAALSERTCEVLRRSLPVLRSDGAGGDVVYNGVVYVGLDQPTRLSEVAAMLAAAPEVGGVLAVHAPTGEADAAGIAALAACAKSVRVPLLACAVGEITAAAHRRRLAEAGLPVFSTPEQAVRGFLHLVQDRRNRAAARELPPSAVLAVAPDREAVARILARARAAGRLDLARDEAMAVCAAYGIPLVSGRAAAWPESAAEAAVALGFPVVLKVARGDAAHAVADLHDAGEVLLAARALAARAARTSGDAPALLVQRQPARARALRLSVDPDGLFGPVIGIGASGAPAASMALDLPPLNLPLAHALLAREARPDVNEPALAETLVRISQLVVDFSEVDALALDPLYADEDGVCVADATVRLRADAHARPRLAISPYPAELAETWNGLTIRPIRPEDAERHGAFFGRLSPEDIRFRFFSAMRALSPEQMARMTQVDYDREMAFVAVRDDAAPGGGDTVGVARLVIEPGGRSGEFAVIVQPDVKGRGVASHLMRRLIDWARGRGLQDVVGQVLAGNAPMLAFVRRLGFRIAHLPGDAEVVEARLTLSS